MLRVGGVLSFLLALDLGLVSVLPVSQSGQHTIPLIIVIIISFILVLLVVITLGLPRDALTKFLLLLLLLQVRLIINILSINMPKVIEVLLT